MKVFVSILLAFAFFSSSAFAQYNCPPATNNAGGWLPPECQSNLSGDEGVIDAINKTESGDASGVGAVAGAVAGGAIGNVASKKNKTLSTVIGAVAGGVAGHYGEKYLKKTAHWEVVVKLNSGATQTFKLDAEPDFKVGDAVIVSGDAVYKKLQ
jgi:outer membrane lipoprotein SlyB